MKRSLINKSRILELSIGFTANKLTGIGFEFIIYPAVIYKYGILKGGVVMTFLSCVLCILTLKFYDWAKRDWLGIEVVRKLKTYQGNNKIGRLTAWILQKSDPVVLLLLSLYYDPFIVVVYMRHGSYNGMSKRDWKIFWGSLLIGNGYWTLACYMGITLVECVWWMITGR